jgi:hypothetical protein
MTVRRDPARLRQLRAQDAALSAERWEIALEHVAWAAASGFSPREVILSVHQALPVGPSWPDAIYALVYAQIALEEAHRRVGRRLPGWRRAA